MPKDRNPSVRADIRVRVKTSAGTYCGLVTLPERRKRLSDILNDKQTFVLLHDVEVENTSYSVPFMAIQKSTIEVVEESDSPVPKSPTASEPTPGPEFWAPVDERRKTARRRPPQLITVNVVPGGCATIVDASETGFLLEHLFQLRDGQAVLVCIGNHMCRSLVRAAVRHTKVHVSGDTGVVYRSGVEFLEAVDGLFGSLQLDRTCSSGSVYVPRSSIIIGPS